MRSQAIRTAQAWTRTGLALIGLVLWGFHLAVEQGGGAVALAVVAAVAAGAFALVGQRRSTELHTVAEPAALPASTVLTLAAAVLVIDVTGLVLVLGR